MWTRKVILYGCNRTAAISLRLKLLTNGLKSKSSVDQSTSSLWSTTGGIAKGDRTQ